MEFEFSFKTRLIFGAGTLSRLPEVARGYHKALIVTGKKSSKQNGSLDKVRSYLSSVGVESLVYDDVKPNPTTDSADEAADLGRRAGVDLLIGLGGGSAIDEAKAVSVAIPGRRPITDLNKGWMPQTSIPLIAIPSTAGTGTEADPWFVLTDLKTSQKRGYGYGVTFPLASVVDPELTLTLPKFQTAATGMDTFYHALEGYLNRDANPLSDGLAIHAMELVKQNLSVACEHPGDIEARTNLSAASVMAGMVEFMPGVNLIHALAHPIGAYTDATHGACLSAVAVEYLKFVADAMPDRASVVANLLGEDPKPERAAEGLSKLLREVGMDFRLSQLGLKKELIPKVAEDALSYMGGSVSRTPREVSERDIIGILERSFREQ